MLYGAFCRRMGRYEAKSFAKASLARCDTVITHDAASRKALALGLGVTQKATCGERFASTVSDGRPPCFFQ